MSKKTACHVGEGHVSLFGELMHHLPYAVFSVALGLTVLSFLSALEIGQTAQQAKHGAHLLFHSFHYMHLIFAVTGSLIMFSRISNNLLKGLIVSLLSGLFFCTLSDIIVPYLAGRLLGISMKFHFCLVSELYNVVPFLAAGLLNGWAMAQHSPEIKGTYSIGFHFGHIFASSLASMFYMISQGFATWHNQIGVLFIILVLAVVIPCTCADVIVPVLFARQENKK